jgi:hypothetical protein
VAGLAISNAVVCFRTTAERVECAPRSAKEVSGVLMTKTEMENHNQQYTDLLSEARQALKGKNPNEAIQLAVRAWDYIDGMLQYQRKYAAEQLPFMEAIDMVMHFAPLLLDSDSLDRLESLLKSQRRIRKNSDDDLLGELSRARDLMWDVYRVWDVIEGRPGCLETELLKSLGSPQGQCLTVLEALERIGLVRRTPAGASYRVTFWTRMSALAYSKCHGCGAVVKA